MSKGDRISDLERQVENLIAHVERLERQGGDSPNAPPVALAPLRSPRMFQ